MPARTTNLFLLEDLEDVGRTGTDLSADRARVLFGDVLQQLALPSYADNGIVFGPFYDGHEGTAIYNSSFRPFRSPVPFMFVRNGVVGDWKFFLDNKDWLDLWARRSGESGAHALAEELRRLPWRVAHDWPESARRVARARPSSHRTDVNAARISWENSSGCSQAAKWPPFSTSLK